MATIYIVEDDVNIREIERYALKNSGYEVEEFESGESLFKRLERAVPSLLLLDIMLPDEDGLEILGKLRANKNTAAIPVIMVTAKTSELDKVKGLDLGADDYITKPFNVKLLVSRCNNLVKSRRKLIEKFRNQQPPTVTDIAVNQADRELIKKATEIISNNFENPEFNMNVLAAELGLGRNKLYTRMKEITGLTPNEFTLKMKLDESMRLLKNNPELNISEISDRLGFSTTQYFSKCFKSVFGMAPLTFRKSNSAATDTSD